MPVGKADLVARSGEPVCDTWCGELELSLPLDLPKQPLSDYGACYRRARVLVRLHGHPIGFLTRELRSGKLDLEEIRAGVGEFKEAIAAHVAEDGLPDAEILPAEQPAGDAPTPRCQRLPPDLPVVTVVVCTRDRPTLIAACVRALCVLDYAALEILVVDNAPTSDDTMLAVRELAAVDSRVRYVREPRPGLSRARNTGLREARGEIIAYTDDDVRVDPGWVAGLVRGFQRRADVGCVTGLVPAASLDGSLEAFFDARVSWATSCAPALFDLDPSRRPGPLYPYAAGIFGTGANFAFQRSCLLELGGFDEMLGAGTRTAGGEDLDIFLRALLAGYALSYEPSAVVWHSHRTELAALRRQMFAYGTGLSAYLTKHLSDRSLRYDMLRRIPAGMLHFRRVSGPRDREVDAVEQSIARGLRAREYAGIVAGPALYTYARWCAGRS
jgi:glycosyltransferase involved in cell wall biosynthesis